MNSHLRAVCPGILDGESPCGPHQRPASRCETLAPVFEEREGRVDMEARFEQPRHVNWRRYRSARRDWHGRLMMAGTVVSALALLVLVWRSTAGEPPAHTRWLLGAASGFFVVCMGHLALFAILSAPHFINFAHGHVQMSRLGVLRPEQVLGWTLRPVRKRRRQKACVRIEMTCLWHGKERLWWMELEEQMEIAQLQKRLEMFCPRTLQPTAAWTAPRTEVAAAIMSVVGAVPGLTPREA